MGGWIFLTVYVAGWAYTARRAALFLEGDDLMKSDGDKFNAVTNRGLGFVIGMIWPLVVAGALMTGRLPKSPRQLQREVDQRDQRIRELERELGIG